MRTTIYYLFLLFSSIAYSQNNYSWTKHNLAFEYSSTLEIIKDSDYFEADNDSISVSIEAQTLSNQSVKYRKNPKTASKKIFKELKSKFKRFGSKIRNFDNSFYSYGYDEDIPDYKSCKQKKYPVIIGIIFDKKNNLSFEIIIDCYNVDINKAIKIIDSMTTLN